MALLSTGPREAGVADTDVEALLEPDQSAAAHFSRWRIAAFVSTIAAGLLGVATFASQCNMPVPVVAGLQRVTGLAAASADYLQKDGESLGFPIYAEEKEFGEDRRLETPVPGDLPVKASCVSDTECATLNCRKNKCAYLKKKEQCFYDAQCHPKKPACNNGKCSKLQLGDRCPAETKCNEKGKLVCTNGICLLKPKARCADASDCASGVCKAGKCGKLLVPDGAFCKKSRNCISNRCWKASTNVPFHYVAFPSKVCNPASGGYEEGAIVLGQDNSATLTILDCQLACATGRFMLNQAQMDAECAGFSSWQVSEPEAASGLVCEYYTGVFKGVAECDDGTISSSYVRKLPHTHDVCERNPDGATCKNHNHCRSSHCILKSGRRSGVCGLKTTTSPNGNPCSGLLPADGQSFYNVRCNVAPAGGGPTKLQQDFDSVCVSKESVDGAPEHMCMRPHSHSVCERIGEQVANVWQRRTNGRRPNRRKFKKECMCKRPPGHPQGADPCFLANPPTCALDMKCIGETLIADRSGKIVEMSSSSRSANSRRPSRLLQETETETSFKYYALTSASFAPRAANRNYLSEQCTLEFGSGWRIADWAEDVVAEPGVVDTLIDQLDIPETRGIEQYWVSADSLLYDESTGELTPIGFQVAVGGALFFENQGYGESLDAVRPIMSSTDGLHYHNIDHSLDDHNRLGLSVATVTGMRQSTQDLTESVVPVVGQVLCVSTSRINPCTPGSCCGDDHYQWRHRYTIDWEQDLSSGQKAHWTTLGWNSSYWREDHSGIPQWVTPRKCWSWLTLEEQIAARSLCFTGEEDWDEATSFWQTSGQAWRTPTLLCGGLNTCTPDSCCPPQNGYWWGHGWEAMSPGQRSHWYTLGWDADSFDWGSDEPPQKCWSELAPEQRDAALSLCDTFAVLYSGYQEDKQCDYSHP